MTWVKKDDQMPINRKVSVLSDAGYRLDDEALCWSSRNLTDGRIPADELSDVSRRAIRKNVDELVRRRRWHRAEDPPCPSEYCPTPGPDGWVIHDYLEYNPSREQVLKERAEKALRQKRWLEKKRGSKTGADTSRDASHGSSHDPPSNASHDASGDGNPVPAPPRPEGSGGGAPESTTARPAADGAGGGGRGDQKTLGETHGPTPNGRPVRPPDTSAVRATIAEARRRAKGPPAGNEPQASGPTALERLRELTPDVPAFVEPTGPDEEAET